MHADLTRGAYSKKYTTILLAALKACSERNGNPDLANGDPLIFRAVGSLRDDKARKGAKCANAFVSLMGKAAASG